MARRSHPFPSRTRKLSFSAPMVVGAGAPVRVGRCQARPLLLGVYFLLVSDYDSSLGLNSSVIKYKKWGLSSAGRAPALHAGGQRFDPARLHHNKHLFRSSSVVELSAVNRSVVGSSPTCGAIFINYAKFKAFFYMGKYSSG